MRKFYVKDFERHLAEHKMRKTFLPDTFLDLLKNYTAAQNILEAGSIEVKAASESTLESIAFHLGCLMYPKKMIKCQNPSILPFASKILRKDLRENPKEQRHIIRIYHYLYRFSLERLSKFVKNPSLIRIFCHYFARAGESRIF